MMSSDGDEPPLVEREDGSWLVSGAASADLLADRLGVKLPGDRDYSTVAGFALSVLKHLPETGETFRHDGWAFEIVDMDGRKIDKLIASRTRRKPARAEAQRRQSLELPEPLLVAVDVAAREIIGLLDDPVAHDAAAERAELGVEPLDLCRRQAGQLLEAVEAEGMQGGRRTWGRRP